jgi:IstB-like ATP binding protein
MAPTAATVPPASGMPAPPPLAGELDALLRRLRLPHIRRAAPEVLATARAQRWEPAEVLCTLLAAEAAGRARSSRATRRASAGFPTGKTFAAWDEQASSIPAPTQAALRTLERVGRRENLVVCGPSGTGKTFFLQALGQLVVQAGSKVAWFSLESLGALVRRHRADDSVTRAVTRILRADLVVVDDIGLLPVGPTPPKGCTGWSTPPTSGAAWRSPATCTRPKRTGSRQRVQGGAERSRVRRLAGELVEPGPLLVGVGDRQAAGSGDAFPGLAWGESSRSSRAAASSEDRPIPLRQWMTTCLPAARWPCSTSRTGVTVTGLGSPRSGMGVAMNSSSAVWLAAGSSVRSSSSISGPVRAQTSTSTPARRREPSSSVSHSPPRGRAMVASRPGPWREIVNRVGFMVGSWPAVVARRRWPCRRWCLPDRS